MNALDLHARVLAGDARAIAWAISLVEDEDPGAPPLLAALHARTGRATVVGVTGAAGTGKSTLVDQLIAEYRGAGAKVAVLAVDPSSPFTGGAILGDRIRMQRHAADAGVFIRSLASRGHLGGLTLATSDVVAVLDAAGFDPILIETVGVGQGEVEVARLADCVVVVVAPGAGDDVQALKAGVMEIADLFVVNKADRDGADRVVAAIEGLLSLAETPADRWRPPVLSTVATSGDGVTALVQAIARHRSADPQARADRRRLRHVEHVRQLVLRRFADQLSESLLAQTADHVFASGGDPYRAADALVDALAPTAAVWLDHIGIATTSLSDSLTLLQDVLGLAGGDVEEVATEQVRVQFVQPSPASGQTALELIEPTGSGSPLARFLETRGPGLHHIAVRVDNIDATLQGLLTRGVRLVDERPRAGAHGSRVAFIHPKATHGVLIELVEPAGASRADR
ncbi:MAG: methylmalonyl Co-A mutase-associated GTPase MeaB [Acidobacteriota bacterium]